jgi:hypothetical protein
MPFPQLYSPPPPVSSRNHDAFCRFIYVNTPFLSVRDQVRERVRTVSQRNKCLQNDTRAQRQLQQSHQPSICFLYATSVTRLWRWWQTRFLKSPSGLMSFLGNHRLFCVCPNLLFLSVESCYKMQMAKWNSTGLCTNRACECNGSL